MYVPKGASCAAAMVGALLLTSAASAQDSGPAPGRSVRDQALAERAKIAVDSSETGRVVGGFEADPQKWPFQVALLATHILDDTPESQFFSLFCGGTLIAPQWVLTAAHCLVDENNELYGADTTTVLVGTGRLTEGRRVAVVEEMVHEGYHVSGFENDIGLLRLAEPVSTDFVRLADANLPFEGAAAVAGWGLREDGEIPLDMHEGSVDIVPNAACNAGIKGYYVADFRRMLDNVFWYQRKQDGAFDRLEESFAQSLLDPLTDDMMCAGKQSGATDSCHGDSGGPLVVRTEQGPLQVGIVSWGGGPSDAEAFCGFEDAYSVYARVAHFRDWVREKTGQ